MMNLVGTEKQVNWASKIKEDTLKYLYKLNSVESNEYEILDRPVLREIAEKNNLEFRECNTKGLENHVYLSFELANIFQDEEKFLAAKENLNNVIMALENEESAKEIIENREDLVKYISNKNKLRCTFKRIEKVFQD